MVGGGSFVGGGWWVAQNLVLSLKTGFKSTDDKSFYKNFNLRIFVKFRVCVNSTVFSNTNLSFSNTSP